MRSRGCGLDTIRSMGTVRSISTCLACPKIRRRSGRPPYIRTNAGLARTKRKAGSSIRAFCVQGPRAGPRVSPPFATRSLARSGIATSVGWMLEIWERPPPPRLRLKTASNTIGFGFVRLPRSTGASATSLPKPRRRCETSPRRVPVPLTGRLTPCLSQGRGSVLPARGDASRSWSGRLAKQPQLNLRVRW